MKNAIILHGLNDENEYYDPKLPASSNQHWLPWIQRQLILKNFKADTPEVPFTFKFEWDTWVNEVERFEINQNTTLVGHSMGGGFWVRYLSEHPEISVDKVVLVAPWLNLKHELSNSSFFDFELEPGIVEHANKFVIIGSDNDHSDVQASVNYLKEKLPNITYKEFHNYGHFCYVDMKTDAFPELLKVVL